MYGFRASWPMHTLRLGHIMNTITVLYEDIKILPHGVFRPPTQ